MKKLAAAAALGVMAPQMALAANLVVNGDFSAGNSGFTSNYAFVAPIPPVSDSLVPEGRYTVGANANLYHPFWADVPARTGSGDFLIVNGAESQTLLWQQTIAGATAGTSYFFEAFAVNLCCSPGQGPADPELSTITFQATQDGVTTVLNTFTTSATPGLWQGFSNTFLSASSSPITLTLFNQSTGAGGNDFGVDDINFGTRSIVAVPAPAGLAVFGLGLGLLGLVARRRAETATA